MSSARNSPLVGKSFYLDLPNGKNLEFLTNSVKQLGGVIESFLSKEVTCVVSSNREAKQETWAEKQTRDPQPAIQPSGGLQRCHKRPLQQPTNNALISRGKKLLHKAIANQDNICGSSILASARSWGVKIIHTDEMMSYIRRLSKQCPTRMKQAKSRMSGLQPPKARATILCDQYACAGAEKDSLACVVVLPVMRLKPPFLKIEDESRHHRPLLQQFKIFPQMCTLTRRKRSPFEPLQVSPNSKNSKNRRSPSELCPSSAGNTVRQKGYCECCKESFTELEAHLHSQRHKEFALDNSHYTLVDNLISQLCSDFEAFSWSPMQRVSPANKSNLGPSEVEVEAAETTRGPPCTPTQATIGEPFNLEHLAHMLDSQGFLQRTEMLKTPASFALRSLQLVPELCKEDTVISNTYPKSVTSCEVELCATPQQKRLVAFPARSSHKRKRSSSSHRQRGKRQALSKDPSNERAPTKNPPSRRQHVCSIKHPFPNQNDSQSAPGQLGLSTVPLHSSPCTSPHSSHEGLSRHSREPMAIDMDCSEIPVQQPGHAEVSGHCSYTGQDISSPSHVELIRVFKFPVAKHGAPRQLDSVTQHFLPRVDTSELTQDMFIQQDLGSCLSLPYCPVTSLSTKSKSSSSVSEWDGPLLCAVADTSRLPIEAPIDAALLGTCVHVPDSNYESHLRSVLWQKTRPSRPYREDFL